MNQLRIGSGKVDEWLTANLRKIEGKTPKLLIWKGSNSRCLQGNPILYSCLSFQIRDVSFTLYWSSQTCTNLRLLQVTDFIKPGRLGKRGLLMSPTREQGSMKSWPPHIQIQTKPKNINACLLVVLGNCRIFFFFNSGIANMSQVVHLSLTTTL